MSESSLIQSNVSYSHHYRQDRRGWVPKGVVLLAVLFVVGLLSACQGATGTLTAEIAVPAEQSGFAPFAERCINKTERPVFSRQRSSEAV